MRDRARRGHRVAQAVFQRYARFRSREEHTALRNCSSPCSMALVDTPRPACRLKSQGRQGMTGNGAPHAFKQADPCSLVVFGASGDLMHRLLFPALYNLAAGSLLPDAFALIGVGRSEMSDDALREDLRKSLQQFATRPVEEKLAQRVVGCATYVRGDVDDPVSYDR